MRLVFLNAMIEEAHNKGIASVVQPDAREEQSNLDVLLDIAYAEGVKFARDKKAEERLKLRLAKAEADKAATSSHAAKCRGRG